MSAKLSSLRKSSTLIIASVFESCSPLNYDYKVTLLKRSQKMKAWPGFYVYPGGRIDPIDESSKWLSVFLSTQQLKAIETDTVSLNETFKSFINNNSIGNRLNTFNNNELKLPAEISFRLCAIRETFEETGILLAHEKNHLMDNYFNQSNRLTSCYDKNDLKKWHKRIKNKPEEFIDLFRELNIVPDINGLHEWANWITPINEKIRFDTVFFTCFLSKLPDPKLYNLDHDEIESLVEFTPEEVLNKFDANKIKLIPPQIYEFKRMLKFKQFNKFSQYSQYRQRYGLKPWLPKFNKEFKFGALPGDFLYNDMNEIDERTIEELLSVKTKENTSTNRILRRTDRSQFKIESNIELDGINI